MHADKDTLIRGEGAMGGGCKKGYLGQPTEGEGAQRPGPGPRHEEDGRVHSGCIRLRCMQDARGCPLLLRVEGGGNRGWEGLQDALAHDRG